MTVTVAAALKKVLLMILKSPKARKFITGLIITFVMLPCLPLIVFGCLFGGDPDDPDDDYDPHAAMWSLLSDEEKECLTKIYSVLDDSKMGSKRTEVTVLVAYYLDDCLNDFNFSFKLVSCFEKKQDTKLLIENVNSTFDKSIDVDEFQAVVDYYKAYVKAEYESWETILENLDDELKDMLIRIEEKIKDANKIDRLTEARVLTVFFLSEHIYDSFFSDKLVNIGKRI